MNTTEESNTIGLLSIQIDKYINNCLFWLYGLFLSYGPRDSAQSEIMGFAIKYSQLESQSK